MIVLKKKSTINVYLDNSEILISDAFDEKTRDLKFRSWHYVIVKKFIQQIKDDDFIRQKFIKLIIIDKEIILDFERMKNIIFNFDCTMFIVNKKFLYFMIFASVIKHLFQSIQMRDIENSVLSSIEYVNLKISFVEQLKKSIVNKIRRQVHIVDDLKVNLLMRSDICDLKRITLDYDNERMILNNCRNMIIFMKIKSGERIKRVIRAHHTIIVFLKSITFVSIRLRKAALLFKERDFMFHSKVSSRFNDSENIFSHIIDANMCII